MSTVFPRATRVFDFWRVNSYGYPCFFSDSEKAQEAWNTLLSFYEFTDYSALKAYWDSSDAPRRLHPHAVESWKATFEEFGLVFVESGSNKISITRAGQQIREAADRDDENEFAWIGINLLLRYPLRGPRRPKSPAHRDSDLLLYRFWYAALLDLDNYIWWTELERILCRVFRTDECMDAIEDVRSLRGNPDLVDHIEIPASRRPGGFYNSLNQVAVHAGMNHLLLGVADEECPYGPTEPKRMHFLRGSWQGMIRRALSSNGDSNQCTSGGYAIARLPSAPVLRDEREYFDYLGAPVTPISAVLTPSLSMVNIQGERVFILSLGMHYESQSPTSFIGPVTLLCQIARGQRVILTHDEQWTYIVEAKELIDPNQVRVQVRRARPITNIDVIRLLQEGEDV